MSNIFDENDGYEDLLADDLPDIEEFLLTLPKLKKKKNEFLIKIDWDDDQAVYFGVRELFWHEMLQAETLAFRYKNEQEMYLAGEHERREILRKAILWVAVTPSCEIVLNKNEQILSELNFDIVEALWDQYQKHIYIGATEASALYNAAINYYNGNSQTDSPVPPIILEIDMLLKFGGMTRKELKKVTTTEMERIQTILMARSEALGWGNRTKIAQIKDNNVTDGESMIFGQVKDTLPPDARNYMQPWD